MTAVPHWENFGVTLFHGDAIEVMRELPEASVDAVVCDPPYSLGFMGRAWDTHDTPAAFAEWCRLWAVQAYRVLKPGGHLLAFGGTRTAHRLTCGIEDAGFEIRDTITWLYGSGFPKSLDVSKAIDKAAGAEREVVGVRSYGDGHVQRSSIDHLAPPIGTFVRTQDDRIDTAPATDDARRRQGWGTALKPASEPIVVARKPLAGTVAQTVLQHGTGALNIDGCRVGTQEMVVGRSTGEVVSGNGSMAGPNTGREIDRYVTGRWPANVVLSHVMGWDGADVCAGPDGCVRGCPVAEMDAQSGVSASRASAGRNGSDDGGATWNLRRTGDSVRGHDDAGGASRFFPVFRYEAKAPGSERPRADEVAHPTVKPLELMRWLVRLVTPPDGTVLDPFAGSGTTGEACVIEGFDCTLIELETPHLPLIVKRLSKGIQPVLKM